MDLEQLNKSVEEVSAKMLAALSQRDEQITKTGAANEKTAALVDDLGKKLIELQGEQRKQHEAFIEELKDAGVRMDEVEKRLGRGRAFGNTGIEMGAKTIAQMVVESPEYKAYIDPKAAARSSQKIDVKSFFPRSPAEALKATFSLTSVTGDLVQPLRVEPVAPQLRRLRIRDLLPVRTIDRDSLSYLEETAFAAQLGTAAITSITRSGQTATVTTTAAHGLIDGDLVRVSGAAQSEYNIDAYVTVTSPTTFTYTVAGSPASGSGTMLFQKLNGTGAAAIVAEGALKPEALLELVERTANAAVIAHYIKITRQAADDANQIMAYIEDRMLYGLARAEEVQLLYGSGTGGNLQGLMTHPRAQSYAWSAGSVGDTKLDAVRRAVTIAQVREFEPTGVVMNPLDFEDVELAKGDDGHYIWMQAPAEGAGNRIWRLPLVVTNAMAETDFLVGGFASGAAALWDREQANVQIATENEDDFIRNKRTLLAEERLIFTITAPEAFVVGDFDAQPS